MQSETRRVAIASWAILGVASVLLEAIVRLTRIAVPRLSEGLMPGEWLAFAATATALGYVEGYRGFVRSFSPRVVTRGFDLARAPSTVHVVLAPLYAMSLVGDTRGRMLRAWTLVALIVAMIVGVRSLPPTWRCIVDASVALSLVAGLVAMCSLWIGRLVARRAQDVDAARPSRM